MTNQTPKDEVHSTDWVSEEIVGQENHLLSRKIREAINILTRRLEKNCDQGNQLPSIYGTILQPLKTSLRITANVITDGGIRMGSESKLFVLKNTSLQNTYYYSFGV